MGPGWVARRHSMLSRLRPGELSIRHVRDKNRNRHKKHMAARPDALTPGEAEARMRSKAKQHGGAWNKHSTDALRANLMVAREFGHQRLHVEYKDGAVRFRHDIMAGAVEAVEPGGVWVQVGEAGGVQMETEDDVAAAAAPTPAPAPVSASPGLDLPMDAAATRAAASAAELERLRQKALTATERRRRQRANRKARDDAARLMAAHAAATTGRKGGDDALHIIHVPLWSTQMGQTKAMTRLIEEVSKRCSLVAGQRGLSMKGLPLIYAGSKYQVTVLSGTAASEMTADRRGYELLALLGGGLTEGTLASLLNKWSQPAPGTSAGSTSTTPAGSNDVAAAAKPRPMRRAD